MRPPNPSCHLHIPLHSWREAPGEWLVTGPLRLGRYRFRCFAQPDPVGAERIRDKRYQVAAETLNYDLEELMEGAPCASIAIPLEVARFADGLLENKDDQDGLRPLGESTRCEPVYSALLSSVARLNSAIGSADFSRAAPSALLEIGALAAKVEASIEGLHERLERASDTRRPSSRR
jgi:hypothetical protein